MHSALCTSLARKSGPAHATGKYYEHMCRWGHPECSGYDAPLSKPRCLPAAAQAS